MPTQLKVLIVDGDVIWRDSLRTGFSDQGDIVICGASPNGRIGMNRLRHIRPDVVLLDADITDLNPAEFTRAALGELPELGIVLTSTENPASAEMAIMALSEGAFDFVVKPNLPISANAYDSFVLKRLLLPKFRSFSIQRYSQRAGRTAMMLNKGRARPNEESFDIVPSPDEAGAAGCSDEKQGEKRRRFRETDTRRLMKIVKTAPSQDPGQIEAVLIGVSTGGPEALTVLLSDLPSELPVPVVIVLHMPSVFTASMAAALDRKSLLTVKEAEDGDVLRPGHVFIARGGEHLLIERGTRNRYVLGFGDGPPENGCKPSADVLFRSAARNMRGHALALLLTGMGNDGVKGIKGLKMQNARVLVQDKKTSVVWGMPGEAVKAGLADEMLPLDEIAGRIVTIVGAA